MKLCEHCGGDIPNRLLIDGKIKVLSSRKFCLACSPFGKHHTRSPLSYQGLPSSKRCPRCEQEKIGDEFYTRRNGESLSPYCKLCTNEQTVERTKETKRLCVEYKGGNCQCCGYNLCLDALEFHHLDRNAKDFCISSVRTKTIDKLKTELDKCILVCCRCHREIEAGIRPTVPVAGLEPA